MARKYVVAIDLSQNELQNARLQNLASAPGSPVTGQVYYDTGGNRFFYWNGSAWVNRATDSDLLSGQTLAQVRDFSQTTGTRDHNAISDFDTQVRTNRLDQMAAPTAAVSFNSQRITNLTDPSGAQDAATKAYVDANVQGLDIKASVRAATTANITLSGAQTIDGISVIAGDRVLVKNQTTASGNGIYVAASGAWSRATDADTSAEVTAGMFVFVEEGTVNGDTGWVLTTNNPITLGTTSLTFTQFSGAGSFIAGAGLTSTGNTFDVIAGATPGSGGPGGGLKVNADDVVIDTNVVVRKFAQDIGDGVALAYVVTHNLGTKDVTVAVYDNTTPFAEVFADVEHTSTTTITIRFVVAPTSNKYRVVVHG